MLASPREPGGDRAFAVAKHPYGSRNTEAFGQCTHDSRDARGGRFEAIERGMPAGSEGRSARLTAEGLDALVLAMRPIADEGVDGGVGDAVVGTGSIGTSKAVGDDALWGAAPALELAPRANGWRRRGSGWRPSCMATLWTIVRRARLEQALDGGSALVEGAGDDAVGRSARVPRLPAG